MMSFKCVIICLWIVRTTYGLRTMAVHNKTHLTVSCEHSSLKQPINARILNIEHNVLAECTSYICTSGAKALPNGIQHTMTYESSLKLRCEIGEQLVNIQVTENTLTPFQKPKLKTQAVHNNSHVTVTCEHSPFDRSNSSIFVTDHNYLLAECRLDNTQYKCTHGAEGLLSGMQFTTDYKSSMKLKCGLGEQLVDVNIVKQTNQTDTFSVSTTYNRPLQYNSSGQGPINTFIMTQLIAFFLTRLL